MASRETADRAAGQHEGRKPDPRRGEREVSGPVSIHPGVLLERARDPHRALRPRDVVQMQAAIGMRATRRALGRSAAPAVDPIDTASVAGISDDASGLVREAAARGTRGVGGPLPFQETIQRAFGRHSIQDIRAHVGGDAAEASRSMGAVAFATGRSVAFASTPDLHTAAHEAAHVVQQQAGVHLKGGVGQAGDPYERHADAVADRVVRGQSAEPLLDAFVSSRAGGAGAGGEGAVQRKLGFEFQSVGVHDNVKVDIVEKTADDKEEDELTFKGKSSAATLIDPPKIVSDSGDLELVTGAHDETLDGLWDLIENVEHLQRTIRVQAGKAKKYRVYGSRDFVGVSKKKQRQVSQKFAFANQLSAQFGQFSKKRLEQLDQNQEQDQEEARKPREVIGTLVNPKNLIRWMGYEDNPDDIEFVPQMTIGVSLGNLGRLIDAQVGNPDKDHAKLQEALGFRRLGNTNLQVVLREQVALIDEWAKNDLAMLRRGSVSSLVDDDARGAEDYAQLKGLLKLVVGVVVTSRLMSDRQASADYLKELAPWMNRTSLGEAYALLSDAEKKAFDRFRKGKVLEKIGTLGDQNRPWQLARLAKQASNLRAANVTTDSILASIANGRDPFNDIEDVGIGEITNAFEPSLEKYHINRSTEIGAGPEGDNRQGMLVELRRVSARVKLKDLVSYTEAIMQHFLNAHLPRNR